MSKAKMTDEAVRDLYPNTYTTMLEEYIPRYRQGGYHSVCLEDRLSNGRYEICQKLGHGGYSTVWLARDRKYVHPSSLMACSVY